MDTVVVDAEELTAACAAILQHEEVPAEAARAVAVSLVDADLKGTHSHGVLRLPRYVKELRSRVTNPAPLIRTEAEGEAFARVDGDGGLGPLVGRYAMTLCLEKAKRAGSATVTARRSRHFGAAGFYAAMALPHDLIGISMTVASPRLAPTGGTQPLFGNNPLAVAVPGDQGFPLVADFAVGRTGAGRLELAAANGESIPPGLARDLGGNPTTDPKVGLTGTIIPIGEHKGYGLTLVIEVLAGLLAGAPYFGVERAQVSEHMRDRGIGHCFMAIDPSRFLPIAAFKQAVATMVARTKGSPRLPGVEEVLIPGELEARRLAERRRNGIPLSATTAESMASLAAAAGFALRW
ncbi:MAG: Ldh family oxidoreductase [Candidatus Latescibacterota bacterium]|jgi:LDH2 family malate/lactate/ureidoglycolate dehydrogenase